MASKKILIIEDDIEMASSLRTLLKGLGYQAVAAYDAVLGRSAAQKEHPNLIILDLALPGGTGLDIMKSLKESEVTSHIPIVVLTANTQERTQEKAFELGAATYITKPFESVELIKEVAKVIGYPDIAPKEPIPEDHHFEERKASMKKILVIEDDVDMVSSLVTLLKGQGYDVISAYDAVLGRSAAQKQHPDLIILDLSLPGGSGLDILKSLKESEVTGSIPTMVLTANILKKNQEKAFELGAAAYVQKPFDSMELIKQIQELLSKPPESEEKGGH